MSGTDAATEPGADRLLADDVGEKVVQGGAQRAVAFVISNLLATAGAVIVLRYLGVTQFGRYGTIAALLTIVYGVTDAGLTMTATRELAVVRDPAQRREVLAHVLGLRVMLTSIGVAGAVVFALIAGYDHTLVVATLVGGAGVVLSSVQTAMVLPLALELRNGVIALLEVLRQAILVALFVVVVLLGGKIGALFLAQLITAIVLLALTPLALRGGNLVAPRFTREHTGRLLVATLPLAIAVVIGVVYFRLLVILMSLLADSERQVGLYVTSARVVELAGSLPYVLVAVLIPVVTAAARDDRDRLSYITARTADVMAFVGIVLALVIAGAARPIVLVLGGHQYVGAASVLQVQAFALVTIFLSAGWSATLIGLGRQKWIAFAAGAGLVTAFGMGAVLIPAHEARGAAVAAVLADLALCVVTYLGLRSAGAASEFGPGRLLRFAAASVPGVAVIVWGGLPAVLAAALAALSFAALAWVLGLVPSELFDALRRALRRGRPAAGGPA